LKKQQHPLKQKNNLTALLLSYRNGSLPKAKLISAISIFAYNFPSANYKWREDECSDFFLYFFHEIERIIESFNFIDASFESYLIGILKYRIITFVSKRRLPAFELNSFKDKEFRTHVPSYSFPSQDDELDPLSCMETEENYLRINITSSFIKKIFSPQNLKYIKKSKSFKKRMLMFVLKYIREVKENEIPFIAESLSCERDWLLNAFYTLTIGIGRKESRKLLYEERRNKYFCKLYLAHEKYASAMDENIRKKHRISINTIKARITSISETINSIIVDPTHYDIAYIMGVPKGTVDSGLFYLNTHLENILPF
jgi:DNA-directed RNA polymerase specialized sigma24 family protein